MTLAVAVILGMALVATAATPDAGWELQPWGRHRALSPAGPGRTGFTLLAPAATGVTFTNRLDDEAAAANQIKLNGSGVALGDVDGDGWCDVYVCGLQDGNALFRNLGGWHFTNVTARAGVACAGQSSTGAALADVDGDGDLDLLVNGIGTGTRLFLNDGHGVFTEAKESGLVGEFGATSLALADVDGDGDLDLYVANYRTTTIRTTGFALLNANGRRSVMPEDRDRLELTPDGKVLENGEPDVFYRNVGGGRFARLSWTDGTFLDESGQPLKAPPRDWGLSVMFRDLNGDGRPDLYVCNDFQSPDRIWLNTGDGRFRAAPLLMFRHISTFSMSVDFADVDRDGREDIFVADMLSRRHERRTMQFAGMDPNPRTIGRFLDRPQFDHSVLQWNRGDGTYADVAFYAGLEATDWTWSAVFLDVDLDGYEDLLCACGHQFDTQDLDAAARIQSMGPWPREKIPRKLLEFPRMRQPKLAFRNRHDLTFTECGAAWGFNQEGVAHGVAMADLDNDGDLDVVINNLNDAVSLYRNDSTAARVAVRLQGSPPNTGGVGARIRLRGGAVDVQEQERIAGGRYLSSDDGLRVFAAGTAGRPMTIEVDWPDRRRSVITGVQANHEYVIGQDQAQPAPATAGSTEPPRPLFADVSARLRHGHQETPFDDFAAQPLLPWRMSQCGPGVAWYDIDADGLDELILGGGKGGRMAVFHWDGQGRFQQLTGGLVEQPLPMDQSGLSGWVDRAGHRWLLAGQMTWEGEASGGIAGYDFNDERRVRLGGEWKESIGPLVTGDLAGNGTLAVFAGGRVRTGRYPEACRSVWYREGAEGLVEDEANTRVVADAGLVTGAVLGDLDNDGFPELILACEWGPIRVFHNDRGQLREATAALGLTNRLGWWTGVATGDFDGDGRMDIVAANWGRNTKYRASEEAPRRLVYGDIAGNGAVDLLEAYRDPVTGRELPERDLLALQRAIPMLAERFPTHAAFGQATIADLLGTQTNGVGVLSANTLESVVLLNRGDRFEVRPLPFEAQLAPAFAPVVADFDGDGTLDLFLSQNFFAFQLQTTRADAGRGLLLMGNGDGTFRAMSAEQSGVRIYGEQRGAAAADFDGDGRVDLAVTQNGAATVLLRNAGATPGRRVRLQGPAGNPDAFGAQIRPLYGDRSGPAREVQSGGGYWSQNSAVLVFAGRPAPTALQVRWPGGQVTTHPVPPGTGEIRLPAPSAGGTVPAGKP